MYEIAMMLSQPDDDIETTYYNLIIITEEVALAMLPRKRKEKQRPLSAHGLVKEARRAVHKATHHHANKPEPLLEISVDHKSTLIKLTPMQRQNR